MPVRHFYLLSHYICYGLLFLFSVCWLHVNEFNSLGGIKGERSEVFCYPESMPASIFTCSHITFAMVYYFYFLFVGSTWMNSIVFGEIKGRGQKSTACSEDISVWDFYCSVLTLHLLWSIIFINHYIVAIYHSSQERYIRIYDKCKGNFFNIGENDNFLSLYCLLKREISFWWDYFPSKQ